MRSPFSLALPLLASASPLVGVETVHKDAAAVVSSVDAKVVPDHYIVVFKDHVSSSAASDHHIWVQNMHMSSEHSKTDLRKRSLFGDAFAGLKRTFDIGDAFKGYSGHFDEDMIELIRRQPDVEYIERDSIVHTMTTSDSPDTEYNSPWGLARISHRDRLNFGSFNKYLYTHEAGEGVDVYVIDTGTNTEHVDFEGRASWGKTIPEGDSDEDGNGHGTHCSGTVAGKKYGVAKKAHIKAVKVLRSNGSGTMSDVVSGVEFAADAHQKAVADAKKGKRKGFKGSTANMSLGGGKSPALDKAVNAAVDAGIHFAVAAGNDNANSCNYSPAAAEKAVTVGASTIADERAYFSNYGKCNDIFAPGLNILSTWIGSKTAVNTISGTSMASPHIAGLLAYLLSLQPAKDSAYAVADITPAKLKAALISIATEGALDDVPSDTTNILAWNGAGNANFTDIVHQGGYKSSATKSVKLELEKEFESGKKVVMAEAKDAHLRAKEFGRQMSKEAKKIAAEIEELVEEEFTKLHKEMTA